MRAVLSDILRWRCQGLGVALATLVEVRGSAPRLVGARMAITQTGLVSGSVSGGCVEGDIIDQAASVLASGKSQTVTYDITDNDELGLGLNCGSIDVFIEPFCDGPVWSGLAESFEKEEPVALVTLVNQDDRAGTRLVLAAPDLPSSKSSNGSQRSKGSVDPVVDAAVLARAQSIMEEDARLGSAQRTVVDTKIGSLDLLVEVFQPRPRLFLVGAVHTCVVLCRMAVQAGFCVIVIDPRKILADAERFAEADSIICKWPDKALAEVCLDSDSYVVTLSHDAKFDIPALACALNSQACYLGAMGSRTTHGRRVARLRELGFEDDQLKRIHAPVGLDIGARGPEEIAVAVLAEIVAVRNGRSGGLLSQATGPIHGGLCL